MHTLKRNIVLHLQTANLNDYPIIMNDIIINSLISFSYHHLCPFKSFFRSP